MLRSALLVLSGNVTFYFLLLVRNLLVARLIPEVDYGIAATFAMSMTVVEMMSNFGLQQQIIQSRDGNSERFQHSMHGFQVLRGLVAATILFLAAGPIAALMRVPEVIWAYQAMALVPALNAFQHFDMHRFNRDMRFWPIVLTNVVPSVLSVLSVFLFFQWFGDYQVMLYALMVQACGMLIASHLVSERRYKLSFDKTYMLGALRFGWPFLLDALVLFAVFNGDKVIVGRELGMEALAFFAMGVTLTLTPTLVASRSIQNFMLPQLSPLSEERGAKFQSLAHTAVQASLLMGALLAAGTVLLGQPIVYMLLGEKYAPLLPFLGWFAVLHGLRAFRGGASVVCLSVGHTLNATLGNMMRAILLPVVWWVAVTSGDIVAILWVGVVGELLAHALLLVILKWRIGLSLRPLVLPHLGIAVVFGIAIWLLVLQPSSPGTIWMPSLPHFSLLLLAVVAACVSMRELWGYARQNMLRQP